jgi:hypothetical protein
MKRPLEITSGICVFVVSLFGTVALWIAMKQFQPNPNNRLPVTTQHAFVEGFYAFCGLIILMCFVGAFILISPTKSK